MSEPSGRPVPYRVAYSGRVREELRAIIARARAVHRDAEVIAAAREIDERLRVYPQFGEPLQDLPLVPAQVWIGTVPPLLVRYTLDEERRLVLVVAPFQVLPNAGF